jgi:hypothetical protein
MCTAGLFRSKGFPLAKPCRPTLISHLFCSSHLRLLSGRPFHQKQPHEHGNSQVALPFSQVQPGPWARCMAHGVCHVANGRGSEHERVLHVRLRPGIWRNPKPRRPIGSARAQDHDIRTQSNSPNDARLERPELCHIEISDISIVW